MAKKKMSIKLGEKTYELHCGFSFLHQLNEKYQGEGLATAVGGFIEEDILVIRESLLAALNTYPDIEESEVEKYLETIELDKLKKDFFDLLQVENCTRGPAKEMILLMTAYAKEAAKNLDQTIQDQVQKMIEFSREETV